MVNVVERMLFKYPLQLPVAAYIGSNMAFVLAMNDVASDYLMPQRLQFSD